MLRRRHGAPRLENSGMPWGRIDSAYGECPPAWQPPRRVEKLYTGPEINQSLARK
jgi:hypothetical protein